MTVMDEPLRIPIEDRIDLHAFSPREVASVVEEYIEAAARKRYREVRVIHGKGTGPSGPRYAPSSRGIRAWRAIRTLRPKPAGGGRRG